MVERKEAKDKYKNFKKKYLIILIFILLLLTIIFFLFIKEKRVATCGDGSFEGNCSLIKPYLCLNGTLVEKASVCGCPETLLKKGNLCFSKYQTNPKSVTLKYILRGEENEINFVVYGGLVDYISNISKTISYENGKTPLRRDFKLKKINEEEQRKLLLPLIAEIQNMVEDKKDQVRVAISIVQNIPYGESEKNITFRSNQIKYSRYPYEVLYDMNGACEGRSELLAFLLKEMGYGVVLFYYPSDNHEVVGIKCPVKYSLDNTGYCFTETTGPSIVSNDQVYYIGWGKLSSEPEIILISEGDSLSNNLYEYKDAKDLIKLSAIIEKEGELNFFQHNLLESLRKKYGLNYP